MKLPRRSNAAARMNKDGRITLPKAVREEYGWQPGDVIMLRVGAGGILLERLPSSKTLAAAKRPG